MLIRKIVICLIFISMHMVIHNEVRGNEKEGSDIDRLKTILIQGQDDEKIKAIESLNECAARNELPTSEFLILLNSTLSNLSGEKKPCIYKYGIYLGDKQFIKRAFEGAQNNNLGKSEGEIIMALTGAIDKGKNIENELEQELKKTSWDKPYFEFLFNVAIIRKPSLFSNKDLQSLIDKNMESPTRFRMVQQSIGILGNRGDSSSIDSLRRALKSEIKARFKGDEGEVYPIRISAEIAMKKIEILNSPEEERNKLLIKCLEERKDIYFEWAIQVVREKKLKNIASQIPEIIKDFKISTGYDYRRYELLREAAADFGIKIKPIEMPVSNINKEKNNEQEQKQK